MLDEIQPHLTKMTIDGPGSLNLLNRSSKHSKETRRYTNMAMMNAERILSLRVVTLSRALSVNNCLIHEPKVNL